MTELIINNISKSQNKTFSLLNDYFLNLEKYEKIRIDTEKILLEDKLNLLNVNDQKFNENNKKNIETDNVNIIFDKLFNLSTLIKKYHIGTIKNIKIKNFFNCCLDSSENKNNSNCKIMRKIKYKNLLEKDIIKFEEVLSKNYKFPFYYINKIKKLQDNTLSNSVITKLNDINEVLNNIKTNNKLGSNIERKVISFKKKNLKENGLYYKIDDQWILIDKNEKNILEKIKNKKIGFAINDNGILILKTFNNTEYENFLNKSEKNHIFENKKINLKSNDNKQNILKEINELDNETFFLEDIKKKKYQRKKDLLNLFENEKKKINSINFKKIINNQNLLEKEFLIKKHNSDLKLLNFSIENKKKNLNTKNNKLKFDKLINLKNDLFFNNQNKKKIYSFLLQNENKAIIIYLKEFINLLEIINKINKNISYLLLTKYNCLKKNKDEKLKKTKNDFNYFLVILVNCNNSFNNCYLNFLEIIDDLKKLNLLKNKYYQKHNIIIKNYVDIFIKQINKNQLKNKEDLNINNIGFKIEKLNEEINKNSNIIYDKLDKFIKNILLFQNNFINKKFLNDNLPSNLKFNNILKTINKKNNDNLNISKEIENIKNEKNKKLFELNKLFQEDLLLIEGFEIFIEKNNFRNNKITNKIINDFKEKKKNLLKNQKKQINIIDTKIIKDKKIIFKENNFTPEIQIDLINSPQPLLSIDSEEIDIGNYDNDKNIIISDKMIQNIQNEIDNKIYASLNTPINIKDNIKDNIDSNSEYIKNNRDNRDNIDTNIIIYNNEKKLNIFKIFYWIIMIILLILIITRTICIIK